MTKPTGRPRQARNDSVGEVVQALLDRVAPPMPVPKHTHLPRGARPFFNDIIAARPRAAWSKFDVLLAVECAKTMHELSIVQAMSYSKQSMRRRGELVRMECRLLRELRIIGWRVRRGPVLPEMSDDDLLARP